MKRVVFTLLLAVVCCRGFVALTPHVFTRTKKTLADITLEGGQMEIGNPSFSVTPTVDLWVVGAGTLGMRVAQLWKEKFEDSTGSEAKIVTETKSSASHADLSAARLGPQLRSLRDPSSVSLARNVLVSIPPTGLSDENYIAELSAACKLWAGPEYGGKLVYISSTAVYGNVASRVSENSPVQVDGSPRTKLMIAAEHEVLNHHGCALRLAGLYTDKRGAHAYWLKNGAVQGSPNGLLNLLHYDDAAAAVISTFANGKPDDVYLACDGNPLSRLAICTAALSSGRFPGARMPIFTEQTGLHADGRICDDTWSRKVLGWSPKYTSFEDAMRFE